jgi:hypothetical protein
MHDPHAIVTRCVAGVWVVFATGRSVGAAVIGSTEAHVEAYVVQAVVNPVDVFVLTPDCSAIQCRRAPARRALSMAAPTRPGTG